MFGDAISDWVPALRVKRPRFSGTPCTARRPAPTDLTDIARSTDDPATVTVVVTIVADRCRGTSGKLVASQLAERTRG